jgi:hypothetical protein
MEPRFLNTRKATNDEEKKFEQMKVSVELKSQTKKESVVRAHGQYLKEREDTLVWPLAKTPAYCLSQSDRPGN